MKKVSIILPCLNEAGNLPLLVPEVIKNIPPKYNYEIICIDDGSTDSTPQVIKTLSKKDKHIKGIILHRRFGHEAAVWAGIEKASGDAIIYMDSDFQHPPVMIPKIIDLWEKGHDLIQLQKRDDQNASGIFRFFRQCGYWVWKFISDGVLIPGVSDFRLLDKKLKGYLISSQESEIFIRGIVGLAAKNPAILSYKVGKRRFGKSSYTMKMFINMFINGFISFSIKPIRLATIFGLLIAILTSLFLIFDIATALIAQRRMLEGWMTIIFLILILNGFIIFYLGILGEYIGIIFKEVKKRPKFIIDKTFNP